MGVVGAFGLTQQGGDTRQHFVVAHSTKVRERYDFPVRRLTACR
jgi:hypothetical protein